jgi:apolipoprotein N-acyltransferase
MARFRALELQKPLIRGANNGITAIVDFRGRITADLPQFDQATLLGTVTPRTGSTPYARSGSLPIVSISLFFLVFISIKAKRQKR